MTPGKVWGEPDAWRYDRGPVAVLKPARTPDYTAPAMGFVETPLYTRTAMEAYAAEKVGEALAACPAATSMHGCPSYRPEPRHD